MIAAFDTRLWPWRCDVMHYFAAAGRMADVNGVLQIEMRGQSRQRSWAMTRYP
jgi:hypothetical protein